MTTFDVTLSVTYMIDAPSEEDAINLAILGLESEIRDGVYIEYSGDVEVATDN